MKSKKVMAGPGNFVYAAEAKVVNEDGSEVYVTVDYYDGEEYTVQQKSMFDFLFGDGDDPCVDFDECYTSMEEARKSVDGEVFSVLCGMIDKLG